ncbi:OLC1v1011902C1 [Oldenlandia corymbosa var. corymbosa]|uniref:OLC1v1011902C1 n=1 Tax=Oldenlandia corymbosa var. corymbosa TaxID=529605 RepID=A0AAV1DUX3_OLDCO|nr:OLC1v1011902C1 [Oldenlandia corymbosa var. corymbosa]
MSRTLAAILGGAAGAVALVGIVILVIRFWFFSARTISRTSETGSSDPSVQAGRTTGIEFTLRDARRFEIEELFVATNNFSDKGLIGQGKFGEVYKGLLQDGMLVAIKRRHSPPTPDFVEEVRYLSSIQHRNLVTLLGYCQENGQQILVYEYIPNGSVSIHLYGAGQISTEKLEFKHRLSIALGAAKGLAHIHSLSPRLLHKDFKTSNVLVDENFVAKVADAGLRNFLGRFEIGGSSSEVTTDEVFLAPEVKEFRHFSEKSDVYSFGVFLLELVSGREALDLLASDPNQNLVEWLQNYQESGDLAIIIDQRLANSFTTEATYLLFPSKNPENIVDQNLQSWRISGLGFSNYIRKWSHYNHCNRSIFLLRTNGYNFLLASSSLAGASTAASTTKTRLPPPSPSRPAIPTTRDKSLENDPITLLNDRIVREHCKRRDFRPPPEDADKYIRLVKEQQERGLQKLKGGAGGSFGYKVDPYTLRPGDYVVHKKVGIGRFIAIKFDFSTADQRPVEYLFIEYADGMAKLPVKQASRMLYRYNLPNESRRPRTLSKLSDPSAWERRRLKGKVAVQKMVVDLMELYIHRLKQRRPPYPKTPAMTEFASQFPYKPTPDQEQAIMDVEKDLTERENPMDRLICGDVGFGKTEVALRAIFCVVSSGKQAMVLAPTIVLAKQHYDVISERFSRYPDIKVGLLSRFQSKSEKEEYLHMIRHGQVDIVVGTHALLGNGVVYNNLGLLVVDEEQRFGVKQKEKIASFKTSVDVLTLSATPIPRTLYLALTGFRDASLITTPPPERVPIKTHLSAFSKEKVISAIKYELDRGGQIFYVLPRIKGLDEVKDFLEESFPNAETAVAHGKQYSKQLEETMEGFALGEIRILICTNIVESGLDIQNANTIIIQDVQQFGLAQLYQLRGRVGRADKEAHAYLFYPDKSLLSDQALERLAALEECRNLGQGFQLAERDMAIRGFGNIFGEQQTGDVGNVGIDLFFEMLFESLSKVDEHRITPVPYQSVQLDLNINPHLPSEYIHYLENPMEIINEAERAARIDIWSLIQFTESLRHQYGKEPYSMEILLKKLYVKRMAAELGITRIYSSGKIVGFKTNMNKMVFKLIIDSMVSDTHRNSLAFEDGLIKAELLLELPSEQLLNWIFNCLAELYSSLPALIKY